MMTGKERMTRIFKHQKTDRIGLYEHFWGDTEKQWRAEGHIAENTQVSDYFNFDVVESEWLKMTADLDFTPVVVDETDETIVIKDGNGATLRQHKLHNTTPEHIDFEVKEAKDYYEKVRPLLKPDPRRMDIEGYRRGREKAAKEDKFFFWSGVNVFELMHPVCGHEYMLIGMGLEPEWIAEMAMDYAKLTVELQDRLFREAGKPDGIWYYEDMGFKQRPFMSPAMYDELIKPAHKYTMDFAKDMGLPVMMHSCGFVEPLLPGMIEAGIDGLQVIEVKAGMDLLRIYKNYGDKIALMGGIDVRTLYSNDRAIIDRELESKIPFVKEGFGYSLHSDHSIPNTVKFDTYKYFVERGLELGRLD